VLKVLSYGKGSGANWVAFDIQYYQPGILNTYTQSVTIWQGCKFL